MGIYDNNDISQIGSYNSITNHRYQISNTINTFILSNNLAKH